MACEQFVTIRLQARSLAVVEQANTIITEYREQGFALILRQLFYQFVARDLLANTFSNYKAPDLNELTLKGSPQPIVKKNRLL